VVHHHHHGGFGGGGCGGCSGFFSLLMLIFVLLMVLAFIAFLSDMVGPSSRSVPPSTIQRTALPANAVVKTAFYTDHLDWINYPSTLERGMESFLRRTGVQPYLYITDHINGEHHPTNEQAEAYALYLYDRLFADEAHVLVIFLEPPGGTPYVWCLAGDQAKAVFDNEARDILRAYIGRYYYDDIDEEVFFSRAFDDAGRRMMQITRSPWIPVMAVGIVAIIVIVGFNWWKKSKAQKNLEAEQTERILNSDLQTFGGDGAAEDLAKKYETDNS
jgi:uncharacterized membrane protein